MPGVNGLELTGLIRRAPSESYTYVIMLTRLTKRAEYLTAVKAGVDAFLMKPLDGESLLAQVDIAARILGLHAYARRLEAIVTVCSYCRRVQRKGKWIPMEQFVAEEFGAMPSHTFCPECMETRVEPELRKLGITSAV
jgi:DNA-binding response OmpR family regulator